VEKMRACNSVKTLREYGQQAIDLEMPHMTHIVTIIHAKENEIAASRILKVAIAQFHDAIEL
jgi:hypothetical protein